MWTKGKPGKWYEGILTPGILGLGIAGVLSVFGLCGCAGEKARPASPTAGVTGMELLSPTVTPQAEAAGTETGEPPREETPVNTPTPAASSVPVITPEVTPTEEQYRWAETTEEDLVDTEQEPYLYEELCRDALLLQHRYPEIISVSFEGKSADGRPIPVLRFGSPEAEQTVLVQAAIHGREHLTSLLVMKQLEQYAKEYDTGTYGGRSYREIFSGVSLLVVPMSNPDGVTISQCGTQSVRNPQLRQLVESFYERDGAGVSREYFFRRFKANANGVDLNRNFPYGWEEYRGTAAPAADHYKGTEPFSEPETRLLRDLTRAAAPTAAISYHATGSVLYWDFGQQGELREKCESLVKLVHNLTGYRISDAATDRQDEAGYCEWAVGICGIPEVTIEVGTVAAPLPISQFAEVFRKNREVVVAVAYKYYVEAKRAGYESLEGK